MNKRLSILMSVAAAGATVAAANAWSTDVHEPSEAECRAAGGQLIAGTGCVVQPSAEQCHALGAEYVEGTGCIKDASAAETEAYCRQEGSRYNAALNACESD